MTLICNEHDMLRLLSEIHSGCLNEYDLTRIAKLIPHSILEKAYSDPLTQLGEAFAESKQLGLIFGLLPCGQRGIMALLPSESRQFPLSGPEGISLLEAISRILIWVKANAPKSHAEIAKLSEEHRRALGAMAHAQAEVERTLANLKAIDPTA